MQLASHGAPGLQSARHALYRSVNRDAARRNIHHLPNSNISLNATGRRILSQGRNLLSKFVGHLTAPGLGHPANAASKSIHSAARMNIQSRLSLPVRTGLAAGRSTGATFLPKAPAVPRSVAQVGLGTARNFSSARPIFQHLAENVSVKGRALCEVELDVKRKKGKENLRKAANGNKARKAQKFDAKPMAAVAQKAEEAKEEDLEHYFPAPVAEVTTSLHIPLAPTPTSRVPLDPQHSSAQGSFLPLPELGNIHASHEMHSLRVSSLFSRLDAANVWDKGVQCSAYSHLPGGAGGVCTILKVEFEGWTKQQVRGVIGESGTRWCALEEARTEPMRMSSAALDGYDSDLSETSSILSGIMEDEPLHFETSTSSKPIGAVDPSESVVLPTLDFSSSFVNAAASVSAPPELSRSNSIVSDMSMSASSASLSDWSDGGSSNGSGVIVDPPSSTSGLLGFSAEFVRRAEEFTTREESGPMESLF